MAPCSALISSVDFIHVLDSYRTVWMAILEKTKKDLLRKSRKGNSIVLWFFLFGKDRGVTFPQAGWLLGSQTLSHIITHCIDHQYAQVIMLLFKNYANTCFSVGVTFKPHSVPYYIFVKETPVWFKGPPWITGEKELLVRHVDISWNTISSIEFSACLLSWKDDFPSDGWSSYIYIVYKVNKFNKIDVRNPTT